MKRNRLAAVILAAVAVSCGGPSGPDEPVPGLESGSAQTDDSDGASSSKTLLQFKDLETNTVWDLKGLAVQGPLSGQRLTQIPAYSAYWFAWASFWGDTAVWEEGGSDESSGRLSPDSFGSVPETEIIVSVPKDAIPPLENPQGNFGFAQFVAADQVELPENDLVLGVDINGDARAYPVKILNWHEIVNHTVGGKKIVVTYCPLTASGINFEGDDIAFGNTGNLFNNNLVMYDQISSGDQRTSSSIWSQMRLSSIQGERAGERLNLLPIFQGTWAAWKELHPETTVLSSRTGYSRSYQADIYVIQGYTNNRQIYFPQETPIDERFHPKEMVFGLLMDQTAKAYPFSEMGDRKVINDTLANQEIVVVFQKSAKSAVAFSRRVAGRSLTFELVP